MFGLDYSDARPSHAAMKAAGVRFVMRYVGSSNHTASRHPKFLTPAEARGLHDAGFAVGVVFETTAERADGGRRAGLYDAGLARAEVAWCGLPTDLPVYFAVDFDTSVGPLITAYFRAVAEVLGLGRTGAYAGFKVIKALFDKGLITYGWQTYAWSGGQWDGRAQIRQYRNGQRVDGQDVDFDLTTMTDAGLWRAGDHPSQEDDVYGGQIPAGKGQQVNISFPRGRLSALGLVIDNDLTLPGVIGAQPQAEVRVAIHRHTGAWQVEQVKVGRAPGDDKTTKTVVHFDRHEDVDFVSMVRLDAGQTPVGWDMS